MRERGRGVSFFLSFFLSLSLSRKKPPSVPQKSVVGFFFVFVFVSVPQKNERKNLSHFSGPRLFSKRKDKKQRRTLTKDKTKKA